MPGRYPHHRCRILCGARPARALSCPVAGTWPGARLRFRNLPAQDRRTHLGARACTPGARRQRRAALHRWHGRRHHRRAHRQPGAAGRRIPAAQPDRNHSRPGLAQGPQGHPPGLQHRLCRPRRRPPRGCGGHGRHLLVRQGRCARVPADRPPDRACRQDHQLRGAHALATGPRPRHLRSHQDPHVRRPGPHRGRAGHGPQHPRPQGGRTPAARHQRAVGTGPHGRRPGPLGPPTKATTWTNAPAPCWAAPPARPTSAAPGAT